MVLLLLMLLRMGCGVIAAVLLVSHVVFLRHQQRVHVFETLEFGLINFLYDTSKKKKNGEKKTEYRRLIIIVPGKTRLSSKVILLQVFFKIKITAACVYITNTRRRRGDTQDVNMHNINTYVSPLPRDIPAIFRPFAYSARSP